MAEQAELKLTEDLTKATSSDEIRDVLAAQPRDEKGKFVSTKPAEPEKPAEPAEPVVFKDTVMIGGKPVEFEGKDAADILAQVKVANQAFEMGRAKQEPDKVEEKKPVLTSEELATLTLKASTGDLKAIEEYMVKSGAIDRYLESKGVKVDQIKSVLETQASDQIKSNWDGAVTEFLANSDWPGGVQNERLLKYKLAELKDDKGQPLAYSPSAASLKRAYEALKEEQILFPREEVKTETKPAAQTTTATTSATASSTTGKRPAVGSTVFGTSQEQGTRKAASSTSKVPDIPPDASPVEIMQAFKDAAMANGQSPDDVFKGAYSGKAQ